MGEFIEDTLRSITHSTYINYEVLVVDDGSNDTYSIIKLDQLKTVYNFKLIRKKNEGLAKARNTGSLEASGEFLAFLDADDMIKPNYYEKSVRILDYYKNVFFVGANAQYFGASDDIWYTWNPELPYILTKNSLPTSSLVFKKDSFLEFGMNDSNMIYGMEDYESIINMIENGYHGISMPYELFLYRIRKDSMSKMFNEDKIIYLYELISKKHSSLFKEYGEEISNLLNANGRGWSNENPTLLQNSLDDLYKQQLELNKKLEEQLQYKDEIYSTLEKQLQYKNELYDKLEKESVMHYNNYIQVYGMYEEQKNINKGNQNG
jgi:glycosyltransferase involved in cell wall biosynthesis